MFQLCTITYFLFVSTTTIQIEGAIDSVNQMSESNVVKKTSIQIGESFLLRSDVYGTNREVNVWTPTGYLATKKTYPVLYIIDGGLQQDFQHISGLSQLASINGNYEELVVVGIKTENRMMELAHTPTDPRYIKEPPEAGKSDHFLRFISTEVIPFIEDRYRTNKRKAVVGESLAGLFITETFLKNPQTFTDYIAISPSLWWDDRRLSKSTSTLIATHDGAERQLYFSMANEGGTMQSGLDMVIEAINDNKPDGLTMHYVDRRASETHSTIYHGAAHDALRKLFDVPAPNYSETPWYLNEGGQPPEHERDGD